MHHVVILKKKWHLMEQILSGTKSAEARWTMMRKHPWDAVKNGDKLFFMENKGQILATARVIYVKQYKLKWDKQAQEIFKENEVYILGTAPKILDIIENTLGKKFCIIIYFMDTKPLRPFNVDLKKYPRNTNWVTVNNIKELKTLD